MKSSCARVLKITFGILYTTVAVQSTAFANDAGRSTFAGLERPVTNEVPCDTMGNCTYRVRNVAPRIQILLRDALQMAFGDSFVIFEPGNIRPFVKGANSIVFRFSDKENEKRFVTALMSLDRLEDLSQSTPQVKFTFKVYALDSVAYNNLELGLSAFSSSKSPLEAAAPRLNLSSSVGDSGIISSGLQLNLGNLTSALFGLKLDLSRLSSWSMNSIDYETVVTNGESISAYTNTPTYSKAVSSSVSVEKADIGLNLSGRVFLDQNGRRLRVENFYVRYGAPTPDDNSIVNETTVSRPSLQIDLGRPYVLGMKTVLLDANSKGNNFIFAGKSSKNTISSTLMLVVNAQLVRDNSTEQVFLEQESSAAAMTTAAAPTTLQLENSNLTITESLALARGFVNPLNQAIGSVLFGQAAGINLRPENIDRAQADRIITVTEKNRVSQQSKTSYVRLLDLVTKGYAFKTLNFSELQVPCQKQQDKCQSLRIELELSEMDSNQPVRLLATYLPEQGLVQVSPNKDVEKKSFRLFQSANGPQQD